MKKSYIIGLMLVLFSFLNKNTNAATYYLKAGGNITTAGDWATGTNGISGTVLTSFTLASQTYDLTNNNSSLTLATTWTVASTSIVNFGDETNPLTMTFASGAGIAGPPRLIFRNNCTVIMNTNLTFNVSATKTIFNTGSTFVVGTGAGSITAYGSPYSNLQIDISKSLGGVSPIVNGSLTLNATLDLAAGNPTVNGNLILNNDLTLGGGILTLGGTISGAGLFVGDNTSGLNLKGNGSIGTLNFLGSTEILNSLTLGTGTSNGTVAIGSNLLIEDGTLLLNSGMLDLNGNKLTVSSVGFSTADFSGSGTIGGSSTSALEINAPSIIGSLQMDPSANSLGGLILNSNGQTLTIGNALDIIDSVLVSDGTLDLNGNVTLKASGTRVARVAAIGATGTITGTGTVENFFPAGQGGWALIGANGVNGQTIANLDSQIPMTCNGCAYGQSSLGAWFNSVQSWDEPTCFYDTLVTSSTAMTPGKGFWVYLSTSLSSGSSNMTWNFSGSLQQGAFTLPVSYNFNSCSSSTISGASDGFNLLANPYPSPISWENLLAIGSNGSDLGSSVYFWNRSSAAASDYNGVSHVGTGPGATDIIPAGEGFYVDNSGGFTSSVSFNESAKTNLNTGSMFRSAPKNNNYLRLRVTGQYDTDDAVFTLIPNATTGYDRYDTKKQFSSPGYGGSTNGAYSKYTSISTQDKTSGMFLSINGYPPSSYSVAIPVLVRVSTTGSYTITADEFSNYGSCAVIRDKLTNAYHDLKVSPYVFNISDTTNTPRFELIVCESGGGIVSIKDLYSSTNISIVQNDGVPVVKTIFPQSTDVVISVFNVLGQQLCNDIKISGTETTTSLNNLNLHGQVVLIKVTAGNESVTKKLIVE